MYKVYILKSKSSGKFYIGHTGDLENRLKRHNGGLVRSTKAGIPWEVIYIEEFKEKSDAYRREMKIKPHKGGNAFKKFFLE